MRLLNTAKENPGTASSTKGSIYSKHLRGIIAFGLVLRIENLQIKILQTLPGGSEFVAYLDALGEIDGQPLPDRLEDDDQPLFVEPEGVLSLRPATHLLFLDQWDSGSSNWSSSSESMLPKFNI